MAQYTGDLHVSAPVWYMTDCGGIIIIFAVRMLLPDAVSQSWKEIMWQCIATVRWTAGAYPREYKGGLYPQSFHAEYVANLVNVFVSDIAIFVLKRDVKLQLTN